MTYENIDIMRLLYETYFYEKLKPAENSLTDNTLLIKKGLREGFGVMEKVKFIKLLQKRHSNGKLNKELYEVIPTNRRRAAYFDFDKGTKIDGLYQLIKEIQKMFGENVRIALSGSSGRKKRFKNGKLEVADEITYSYHIVLPDIVFKDKYEMESTGFRNWVRSISLIDGEVDDIYDCNRAMKTVFQHKKHDNERQQDIIPKIDIEANLTTNICDHIIQKLPAENCSKIDGKILEKLASYNVQENTIITQKVRTRTQNNDNSTKKQNLEVKNIVRIPQLNTLELNLKKATNFDLLMAVPNLQDERYKIGRKRHFRLMTFAYHNKISFEDYKKWEHTYDGDEKDYFKEKDYRNCSKYPAISRNTLIHWLKIWYGGIEDPALIKFKQEFIKKEESPMKSKDKIVYNTQYMEMEHINGAVLQMMYMGMAAGKTHTVIEWLKQYLENRKVIWITNKVLFAKNLDGRLTAKELNFTNYKDVKGNVEQRKLVYKNTNKLVINLESLHYTLGIEYDVVIIDEIESLYASFLNEKTHSNIGKNFTNNYAAFENHLFKAKKIFAMDAFLHKRTKEYLEIIRPSITQNMIMRCKDIDDMKKYVIDMHYMEWLNQIITEIRNGKNLYIYYPHKTAKGSVLKISMDDFKQMLKDECGLEEDEIEIYHSGVSQKVKKQLLNATRVWSQKRVIITNSSITVGINYDDKDRQDFNGVNHFDRCYLCYADFVNPRDVIQTSLRVRQFKENDVIYLTHLPNMMLISAEERVKKKKENNEELDDDDCYVDMGNSESFIPKLDMDWNKKLKSRAGFDFLRKKLIEENDAKSYKLLLYYFKIAGCDVVKRYKKKDEFDKLKKRLKLYRNDGESSIYSYKNIKRITEDENELAQMRRNNDEESENDQLEMDRYNIDKFCKTTEGDKFNEILFNNPDILSGLIKLKENDKILNYVLKYKEDCYNKYGYIDEDSQTFDTRFEIVSDKFSEEDKLYICRYIHVSHKAKDREKFLKLKDYYIRKAIMKLYFGDVLRKPNHSVELKPKFEKILQLSLKFFLPFCRKNAEYNADYINGNDEDEIEEEEYEVEEDDDNNNESDEDEGLGKIDEIIEYDSEMDEVDKETLEELNMEETKMNQQADLEEMEMIEEARKAEEKEKQRKSRESFWCNWEKEQNNKEKKQQPKNVPLDRQNILYYLLK